MSLEPENENNVEAAWYVLQLKDNSFNAETRLAALREYVERYRKQENHYFYQRTKLELAARVAPKEGLPIHWEIICKPKEQIIVPELIPTWRTRVKALSALKKGAVWSYLNVATRGTKELDENLAHVSALTAKMEESPEARPYLKHAASWARLLDDKNMVTVKSSVPPKNEQKTEKKRAPLVQKPEPQTQPAPPPEATLEPATPPSSTERPPEEASNILWIILETAMGAIGILLILLALILPKRTQSVSPNP
jgi:hypothetical protein